MLLSKLIRTYTRALSSGCKWGRHLLASLRACGLERTITARLGSTPGLVCIPCLPSQDIHAIS